uniref:Uncharacterized protein n=1 Tax=Acrobeloides nanus TaxID=290746 RepID=A0A914EFH4_9BILA
MDFLTLSVGVLMSTGFGFMYCPAIVIVIKNLFRCAISHYTNSIDFLTLSVGVLMSTGFGFMYCPAIVIVTMYFERLRALAMGVTVCGAGVGTFIVSKVISFLIIRYDWRTVFIIYAGLFSTMNTHRTSNFKTFLAVCPMWNDIPTVELEPIYDDKEEEMKEIKKNKNY